MTSAINPLYPVAGNPTTQSVRDNFAAAASEISDLQKAKTLRVNYSNESIQQTQYCLVANVPQVITFNQTVFKFPNDNTVFEVDSVNSEVIFHETGFYHIDIIVQGIRQTSGAPVIDWSIHTQYKEPSGSFTNFTAGCRKKTFDGGSAAFKEFFNIGAIFAVSIPGSRFRVMQTATDVTKDTGIISYPAVAPLSSVAGITMSFYKVSDL